MSQIIDPLSGNPNWTQMMGRVWTRSFNCTRFVQQALNLPYISGGGWGWLSSLHTVRYEELRCGDVVVWLRRNAGCFQLHHAGIWLNDEMVVHNGWTSRRQPGNGSVHIMSLTLQQRPDVVLFRGRTPF